MAELDDFFLDAIERSYGEDAPLLLGESPFTGIDEAFKQRFGETLRLYHEHIAGRAFGKVGFEYAFVRTMRRLGRHSYLAPAGNPGHDIVVEGERISLKTQANRGIKRHEVHISKFMELGRGTWGDNPKDLVGLRDQFLEHLTRYHRVLMLRCFPDARCGWWYYELIEIPKQLLELANQGTLEMRRRSSQFPRPGTCSVFDQRGFVFELYFDGGGERKLQVRRLRKDACILHAEWSFCVEPL